MTTTATASITPPALLHAWPEQGGTYVGIKAAPDGRAWHIVAALVAKQTKNEGRKWPDWRTQDPNKAIEHDRTADAVA